jgi:hypothetical protein
MLTKRTTMKFRSSVVTTSSTPKRTLRKAGPSKVSAPPKAAAIISTGMRTSAGSGKRPVPSTMVMTAPI